MMVNWDIVVSVWVAYAAMHLLWFFAGIIVSYAKGDYK